MGRFYIRKPLIIRKDGHLMHPLMSDILRIYFTILNVGGATLQTKPMFDDQINHNVSDPRILKC